MTVERREDSNAILMDAGRSVSAPAVIGLQFGGFVVDPNRAPVCVGTPHVVWSWSLTRPARTLADHHQFLNIVET